MFLLLKRLHYVMSLYQIFWIVISYSTDIFIVIYKFRVCVRALCFIVYFAVYEIIVKAELSIHPVLE